MLRPPNILPWLKVRWITSESGVGRPVPVSPLKTRDPLAARRFEHARRRRRAQRQPFQNDDYAVRVGRTAAASSACLLTAWSALIVDKREPRIVNDAIRVRQNCCQKVDRDRAARGACGWLVCRRFTTPTHAAVLVVAESAEVSIYRSAMT